MANYGDDTSPTYTDPIAWPLPIVPNSITGIGRIVSPGLWNDNDSTFGAYGMNMPSGVASKMAGTVKDAVKKFYEGPPNAQSMGSDAFEQPDPGRSDTQQLPRGDSPPSSDKTPLTSDVWTDGAQPINTYGGGGMAYAGARSDNAPNRTTGQHRADIAPTQDQQNSGFTAPGNGPNGGADLGGQPTGLPGMLGRLFENIGNWRDQNRMTLLALAGGLAGSQSWGQGLGRGFSAAAATIPQQNALNNQNATINFLTRSGMDPNMARAISANPQLVQESLGQMTGLTPPKTLTVQPGQMQMQWVPGKGWQRISGAAGNGTGGSLYDDPAKWDAASIEDRLAAVRAQYGDDYAASVKALGEGRYLPPNRQGQVWGTAQSVYGMLDQGAIKARQDAYKKFYGGGDVDKRLTAFNQAFAQHGADLPETIEANSNYSFGGRLLNQPLSDAGRLVGTNTTTGPLATNTKALVDEVANLWKASGSTDKEIEGWHDAVYNDLVYGSPQQQRAAAAKLEQLGEGAINALEDQKQRDFGPAAASMPPLMSPATRQSLAKLKAWAAGGPASKPAQQAPQAINAGAIIEQAGHHYQHMPDGSFKQLD